MARAPSLAGVILAAGESTRMQRDKALLAWQGKTFLGAAMDSLRPHCQLIIVVAGKNVESLKPVVFAAGGFLVVNPNTDRGQFSSLQVGLQEVLDRGRDAAMVTLVDRPPASLATIKTLSERFLEELRNGHWAVVPQYGDKHGHPIVIGREMIEAFLRAPAEATAREVEHKHQQRVVYVPVDDANVTMNIDTPEDYARLGK
jgi:CTP:molybdopterin cytidylyltransferase MocA